MLGGDCVFQRAYVMPSKDLDRQSDKPIFARHKPGLRNLLTAVGLDVVYERADGDLPLLP